MLSSLRISSSRRPPSGTNSVSWGSTQSESTSNLSSCSVIIRIWTHLLTTASPTLAHLSQQVHKAPRAEGIRSRSEDFARIEDVMRIQRVLNGAMHLQHRR